MIRRPPYIAAPLLLALCLLALLMGSPRLEAPDREPGPSVRAQTGDEGRGAGRTHRLTHPDSAAAPAAAGGTARAAEPSGTAASPRSHAAAGAPGSRGTSGHPEPCSLNFPPSPLYLAHHSLRC